MTLDKADFLRATRTSRAVCASNTGYRMNRTCFRVFVAFSALCLAHASSATTDEDMEQKSRQKMAAIHLMIQQAARRENATLVKGSIRAYGFGADTVIGFYTVEAAGKPQQYMVVLEQDIDIDAGEIAPPIEGPLITMKRYSSKTNVVGHLRIDGERGRTLDTSAAKINEARDSPDKLDVRVILTDVGTGAPVTFHIKQSFRDQKAAIRELAP